MWSRLSKANSSIGEHTGVCCGHSDTPVRPVCERTRISQSLPLSTAFTQRVIAWTLGCFTSRWLLGLCCTLAAAHVAAQRAVSQDSVQVPAQVPAQVPFPSATQESPRPIPAAHSSREVAAQILQQSILQSVWGPPAYCVVRQSVNIFGKQLNGVGKYVRGGRGSGKLKFDLRMPAGDQINTLLQVSDGQRLLSIEAIGDVRKRTEVDLGKVRPRLVFTNESLRDPVVAMYLAIGGQAEMLRKIYQKYDWISVREGKLGDIPVWWLKGCVPPEPVNVRSVAEVDNIMFAENHSGLLPTRIEIAVGRADAELPYWLYQMEQGRIAEDLSPSARSEQMHIVTEWATPILLTAEQMPSSLFEPPSSNEPLFDDTDRYLPPAPTIASAPGEPGVVR